MDRGAWWATVSGIARVGYDLATKSVLIKAENVICSKPCIPIRKDICAESGNYKC